MQHLGYEGPQCTAHYSQLAAKDEQRIQDDVEQVASQGSIQWRPGVSKPSKDSLHASDQFNKHSAAAALICILAATTYWFSKQLLMVDIKMQMLVVWPYPPCSEVQRQASACIIL